MNRRAAMTGVLAAAVGLLADRPAAAFGRLLPVCTNTQIDKLNRQLAGRLLDFTHNHGSDNRVYSPSLGDRRDLYVYLPPGYDGTTPYPLIVWLHGLRQSEENFLDIAPMFDAAIRCGKLPPTVLVAVDGSTRGRPGRGNTGSFYMNGPYGRFEDFVACDVYEFMHGNFALCRDRRWNVLAGGSMGGYGAYYLGFKHRHKFGLLAGFIPALDIRYADCHDRYFADFDPNCVMERDHYRPGRTIARYLGIIPVKERRVVSASLGKNTADGLRPLAERNPVELLDTLAIQPGEFEMFIGYAGKDEFNLDAGVEHFLHVAARRGIDPTVYRQPNGHHDPLTAVRFFPAFCQWMTRHVGPLTPPVPVTTSCGECERLLREKVTLGTLLRRPGPIVEGNPFAPSPPLATLP